MQSLEELVGSLEAPRVVWLMIPAGDPTEQALAEVLDLVEPGDVVVDGGNSNFRDTKRRFVTAAERGVHYVDAGVSGGIWGLKVGYCIMVGGAPEPVALVEPAFRTLAPEDGYAHVGPSGAGHFAKMVHNGIEYGLMQAYAEGFEIMRHSEYEYDLAEVAGIWRYGSVVRSWLLELLYEAFQEHGSAPRRHRGLRRGLGRGALDDRRGDQRERAGAGDLGGAVRAVRLAPRDRLRGEGRRGAAEPVRRPRDQGRRDRRHLARPALSGLAVHAALEHGGFDADRPGTCSPRPVFAEVRDVDRAHDGNRPDRRERRRARVGVPDPPLAPTLTAAP